MPKGFLCLVLHAHLPYVRHTEHEHFLEERWLFEAITETYIPLLSTLESLQRDGIPARLTLSISPPLAAMLADPLLQQRYISHLDLLLELAEKEVERTRDTCFAPTARMYLDRFRQARILFSHHYQRNLLQGFKGFQEAGYLEIITCAATHGYLPLLATQQSAVRAQIGTAVQAHTHHFGQPPAGIWLPECAYSEGIDEVLAEFGIKFFFVDTHGLLFASRRPRYGIFAPLRCPSGVHAFGRDVESSKQVWSASEGYPGDFDYREYYRDIGFDLDIEYIKPYIHPDGIRVNTGIKYYRITGRTNHKEPYVPETAREKAAVHAGNFLFNRQLQIDYLAGIMDRRPIVVAPYDAELFGHWWYEGPLFLEYLCRKVACDQDTFRLITPSQYLQLYPVNQTATPCTSSWGNKGYHEVWLCQSNDWVYRHLHMAATYMQELADSRPQAAGTERRALTQAARELLLAQSSDWAFIMSTGTMVDYAVRRTRCHLDNFLRLCRQIREGNIDEQWLNVLEEKHNIFPHLDYTLFRTAG
ncbi:MAG: glycoside hydrolase family 57 protein [Desulfurispora sp.]|uniref:glycoside hydrolase family 57 protein n=1 Tax=Desulfurispora sp. TaxID=3014275 RepID=UPI004049CEBD